VVFVPDELIFKNYKFRNEYIVKMLKNYCYLNNGLTIIYNGEKYYSENGLKDLLGETIHVEDQEYPIIHLKGDDIEIAMTHSKSNILRNIIRSSTGRTPRKAERIWPRIARRS
jgi:topoisomerase-4 subunit B